MLHWLMLCSCRWHINAIQVPIRMIQLRARYLWVHPCWQNLWPYVVLLLIDKVNFAANSLEIIADLGRWNILDWISKIVWFEGTLPIPHGSSSQITLAGYVNWGRRLSNQSFWRLQCIPMFFLTLWGWSICSIETAKILNWILNRVMPAHRWTHQTRLFTQFCWNQRRFLKFVAVVHCFCKFLFWPMLFVILALNNNVFEILLLKHFQWLLFQIFLVSSIQKVILVLLNFAKGDIKLNIRCPSDFLKWFIHMLLWSRAPKVLSPSTPLGILLEIDLDATIEFAILGVPGALHNLKLIGFGLRCHKLLLIVSVIVMRSLSCIPVLDCHICGAQIVRYIPLLIKRLQREMMARYLVNQDIEMIFTFSTVAWTRLKVPFVLLRHVL